MQGEDLARKASALKPNSHSPDCALLSNPEVAGGAHGPDGTVHMETCKESTEELWHFSFSWLSCAWSTLESHPLNPCWNTSRNKEETEQRDDCGRFLLRRSAAEATRPGSSRVGCWTKGIKYKWTPRCCPICLDECGWAKVQRSSQDPLWLLDVRTVLFLSTGIRIRHTGKQSTLPSVPSAQPQPEKSAKACVLHLL